MSKFFQVCVLLLAGTVSGFITVLVFLFFANLLINAFVSPLTLVWLVIITFFINYVAIGLTSHNFKSFSVFGRVVLTIVSTIFAFLLILRLIASISPLF